MAAPSTVRVEASSITSTVIRWTYAGSASIAVYRSTDGSSYSEVTADGSRVLPGTTSYTDTGLTTATKYWYKLSDDEGSTFSSVVTVYTHTCGVPASLDSDAVLPRAGSEVTPETFNDLAIRVETGLVRFTDPQGRTCVACISDGALVLDCITYANCERIEVEVDADVNSISMPNCENDIKTIDFIIPPNTTRKICGWPGGSGFTGDECQQAPISGGSAGKTMSVSTGQGKADPGKTKSSAGTPLGGSGSGGGTGSGCTCVPNGKGQLTIKSCNSNNSLACSGSKSLRLIACGGRGPYTWSNTGSVSLSKTTGPTTTVTPPTNSGSGVAGTAYHKYGGKCDSGTGAPEDCATSTNLQVYDSSYGCNDQVISACGSVGTFGSASGCTSATVNVGSASCATITPCADNGTCVYGTCDSRSGAMIAANCNPCGVQAGATVTVTDALGTQTTIVLQA